MPPVTNAFFDCNPQKLGGGGAGTEYSLLIVAASLALTVTKTSIDERRNARVEDGNIIILCLKSYQSYPYNIWAAGGAENDRRRDCYHPLPTNLLMEQV